MIDEDYCVYMKRSETDFVILSLYVDDILLAGNSLTFVKAIKSWLSLNFEMKDMGEAKFILGVKIHRDRSKNLITLSQESYIEKILERFRMRDCKSIDTSVAKGENLSLETCPKTQSEKRRHEEGPIFKCNWEFNVCNVVHVPIFVMQWVLLVVINPIQDKHIGKMLRES